MGFLKIKLSLKSPNKINVRNLMKKIVKLFLNINVLKNATMSPYFRKENRFFVLKKFELILNKFNKHNFK